MSGYFIINSTLCLSVEEVVSMPALNMVHIVANKLFKFISVLELDFSCKRVAHNYIEM